VSAIVVCSGKGSPGATFIAVNLAAAFARTGRETILLDFDPAGGDVCCYLGLDPRRGLYPLLRMEGSVSGSERLLAETEERSGFNVIYGFPDASELATPDVLREALVAADAQDRTVVADLGRVSKANSPLAAESELVLLVVRADLVSVLGAERALRCLEAAGADRNRIEVVVCGHERRRPADLAEVEEALRLPVLGAVPLDRRGVRKALIAQRPVVTRRSVRAFDVLSKSVGQEEARQFPVAQQAPDRELTEVSA
jgi:MinD-like ATPase involved in chromosome partitioning or flagellar assembly